MILFGGWHFTLKPRCDDWSGSFIMSKAECVPYITVDARYCKGCGLCVKVCPYGVLRSAPTLTEKGYNLAEVVQPEACVKCHKCVFICPDLAIDVFNSKVEAEP